MTQQQVVVSVATGEWVSLGVGPLLCQCLSHECKYAVGDAKPTTFNLGFEPNFGPILFNTTSTIWAAHTQPPGLGIEALSVNAVATNVTATSNYHAPLGHFKVVGSIFTTFEMLQVSGHFITTGHGI